MSDTEETCNIIEKFAKNIVELHEKNVRSLLLSIRSLIKPKNDSEKAIASYYEGLSRDEIIARLGQIYIESVIHDLFFVFEDNKNFQLILKTASGLEINLADRYPELRAKPLDWIEQWSSYGLEGDRQNEYISKYLSVRPAKI